VPVGIACLERTTACVMHGRKNINSQNANTQHSSHARHWQTDAFQGRMCGALDRRRVTSLHAIGVPSFINSRSGDVGCASSWPSQSNGIVRCWWTLLLSAALSADSHPVLWLPRPTYRSLLTTHPTPGSLSPFSFASLEKFAVLAALVLVLAASGH
jgi:hypothetical protein